MLACFFSFVGNTTLHAQAFDVATTPATALENGCYVVETTSKNRTGLMTHNASQSSRAFLIDESKTAESEISDKNLVWRLETNDDGTISLFNLGTNAAFPADAARNQNCSGSATAKLVWNAEDGSIYQTNYTHGTSDKLYVHCNETSYLNFSYWSNYNTPGSSTCVKASFYKVDSYDVTIEYQGKINETAQQVNLVGETFVYTVPDMYKNYPVLSAESDGATYAPGQTISLTSAATITVMLSNERVETETVEWNSNYGTINDQASPFYYVGVQTPREAKKLQLSAITITLCGGSRSSQSYLAIATSSSVATGKLADADVLGVSNEKYQPTNGAGEKYTYTFNTPVELEGDKIYYLYWVSGNTSGNYNSVGQRLKVVNGVTYAPSLNLNGTRRTDLAPEYAATLTYNVADKNEFYKLLVNVTPAIACDITWNGDTVNAATSTTFYHFATDAVSNNTVTVMPTNPAYTAISFTWDGLTNDTVTAALGLDIFSATYGEKWLRVASAENSNYVWDAVASTDGTFAPMTNTADVSSDSQIWCFVGTPENFKIYNFHLGEDFALTTNPGTPTNGTYTNFTEADNARAWTLGRLYADATTADGATVSSPGYTFYPAGETASLGLNMFGGIGNRDLRFYAAGASNAGSHWQLLDASFAFTFTVEGLDSISVHHPYVANLTCGEGAIQIKDTNFNTGNFSRTLFLSRTSKFTLSNVACGTGYSFKGFSLNGGALVNSISCEKTTPVSVTATYEETNPGVRYLYFNDKSRDAIGVPYRIPAIAQAANGDILAFNDRRYSGGDIGSGHLDVVGRISKDNGKTWGDDIVWFDGDNSCGYGDPAVVSNRETNRTLLISCSGRVMFPSGTLANHQGIAQGYLQPDASGEWKLEGSISDLESQFYTTIFKSTIRSMFIGSGKIVQSRIVKKGEYYRLYCALLTKEASSGANTNRVVYSDDFGQTWSCLGNYATQAIGAGADEPKVEELPDGSIVISTRKSYGRYFNIFTFSNDSYTSGSWGTSVQSNSYSSEGGITFGSNACNGEILMVKAVKVATGDTVTLAMQSIPTGNAREKTAIYYKPLTTRATSWATPAIFAKGWSKPYYICDHSAAYSTMVQLHDGTIAVYQEENVFPGNFDMVYIPLTVETITDGAYKAVVEEQTTAIETLTTQCSTAASQQPAIFDLQGRRVANRQKGGVYIVNGKKTIF